MANWTILLGIAAFSLSLTGTFVVRSGVLTSVHSFATDPARGVFILMLLLGATGGGLLLYAARSHKLRSATGFALVSKEGGLLLNNLLLVAATFTVFLGTFYPLMVEAFSDEKISVGAPYFQISFTPIMIVLIAFMGIGPLVKWRKDSWENLRPTVLEFVRVIAFVSGLVLLVGKSVLGAISMGFAVYLAFGTLLAFGRKIKFGQTKTSKFGTFKLMRAQPASVYGFLLAHLGIAIFMAGVTAMSVWSTEDAKVLKLGESMDVGGYEFTLKKIEPGQSANYQKLIASVQVTKVGETRQIAMLKSERRFYPVRDMVTTEAGIQVRFMRNLYVGVGEGSSDKGWVVRAYTHSMVCWIWLGALMMALAGFVSLLGQRQIKRREQR